MADTVSGILKRTDRGFFELTDPERSYKPVMPKVVIPQKMVRDFGLVQGAEVVGIAKKKPPISELIELHSVCGLAPAAFKARLPYTELTAIPPYQRFNLEKSGMMSMRMVDLIAPIAKGTRGLIVSPPKAGKTTLVAEIASAIRIDEPDSKIIVVLIDERPEEVTQFRRNVKAQVVASSIDQTTPEHIALAEIVLDNIRLDLECGRDVVVLVDSITRMGRAFNKKGSGTGRIMSGGLEAGTLEIPRRFLGMARKIENGGSVTIIATALVDTGSRMDQLIFEEFKGTGNSELVLSRKLAEARVFPAIDIPASGTRMDEALYGKENSKKLHNLRKALVSHNPQEAIATLEKIFGKYPTNEELFKILPG